MKAPAVVAQLSFTTHLARHLDCPPQELEGKTVREVLEGAFAARPRLRGYLLDDQGALRPHVQVFVDGTMVKDRLRLNDPVGAAADIRVLQALSGGAQALETT